MQHILADDKKHSKRADVDVGRLHHQPAPTPSVPIPLVLDILTNLTSLETKIQNDQQNLLDLSNHLQRLRNLLTYLISDNTLPENPKTLEFMALYDSLTHLPNRLHFEARLRKAIETSTSDHSEFYVIFLDLDGFKEVNDSHGHEIGDWLLRQVARRLRHNLRDHDFVARYGGDEFTAIISADQKPALELILKRLVANLSRPFHRDDMVIQIGVSIGVAHYPLTSQNYADLIKKADMAMYMAKSAGKNGYRLCNY